MVAIDYLLQALMSAPAEDRKRYGDSPFRVAARDLQHSIEGWMAHADYILDVNRWNVERLSDYGRVRQPRIRLYVYITQKDNLVVEWCPDLGPDGVSDFVRFSEERYGYGDPANRLVMIHEFEQLRHANWDSRKQKYAVYPKHVAALFEAIRAHVRNIHLALRTFVEVNQTSDLEMLYEGGVEHPRPDTRIVGVEICDLEERRRLAAEAAKAKWLDDTFRGLDCKPEDFLDRYYAIDSYAGLARECSTHGKRISVARVKSIIERLRSDYPEIANRIRNPKKTVSINR